jgi:hypothetical protein
VIGKALEYVRLDGGTKVEDRLRLVQRFNREQNLRVFLISTKAGGLGLNITSAQNVVIFDPSWNPAHDCQAQDRAYRIGQTKDVHVYRLITLGTIEEMIYVRQIYKQQLSDTTLKEGVKAPRYFEGIQGDPSQQGELFGLRNLLQLQEEGVLKGIQDAYVEDTNGIRMSETRVRYEEQEQEGKGNPSPEKKRKKNKSKSEEAEDDMVEVANEFMQLMEPQDSKEKKNNEPQQKQQQQQQILLSALSDVHEEISSSSCDEEEEQKDEEMLEDLPGATRFLHEAIIREDLNNQQLNARKKLYVPSYL